LPALTGLRFFLALWVVLHHLVGQGQMLDGWMHDLPPAAQRLLEGGYLAVGTFFVLSGFVMSLSYRDSPWTRQNLLRYSIARFGRIYPAYLVSLLIVSPWIFDFLNKESPQPHKAAMLANYGLVLQGWTGNLGISWNTPAWSLSCEFFFYLCFPVAVTLLGGRGWRTMALVIAACLLLPLLLRDCGVPEIWKPIYRLADFLIGIAVAGLYRALSRTRLRGRGFWLYLPAILLGFLAVAYPLSGRFSIDQIMRPVNAALILGLALGGGVAVRTLAAGWVGFLGQASYSMYIVHIPLLWWYRRLCFDQNPFLSKPEAAVLFLLATIGVSALMLRWVEEPANRGIRRWAEVRYGS
jgi:peptidoglycan/LPS O-acetylase OafA/YrhL